MKTGDLVNGNFLRSRCNLRIAFSDQPVTERLGYCFGLGMHLQFLVDVLQMKVDGGGSDSQLCPGGFVVMPFDQQLQDADLVR